MDQLPTSYKKNPEQAAVLKITTGMYKGKQFRLIGSRITIGRSNDCDVVFKDSQSISREHALITFENDSYFIKTLNLKNPVFVNGKKIELCHLQSGNKITVGDTEFIFENKSPLPALYTDPHQLHQQQKSLKNVKTNFLPRLMFFGLILFMGFLLLSEDNKVQENQVKLKTQQEVAEELEVLKKLSEEEISLSKLSPERKAARIAFIKGFRDYRKGYFQRALKTFSHCITLDRTYSNCQSYIEKSNIQIEKLIQKKMVLGKRYQQNKQFGACKAIFKSVTIMVQDTNSSVYKEALLNKRLCDSKTKHRL